MISVQSYPELYTSILGWMQYENAWDLLSQTGLVYLPFISMLIRNFVEPYTSMGAKPAAEITLRRVEVDFFLMICVVFFAAKPLVALTPKALSYQPVCQVYRTAHIGNSGTTYDEALAPLVTSTRISILFDLVMRISEGFTSALGESLTCPPNLRGLIEDVHLTSIQDPKVRAQTQAFYSQCFVPARAKYLKHLEDKSGHYGKLPDTEWLGSRYFRDTPGYYDTFTATSPVPGFAFSAANDWDEAQGGNHEKWGKPSCKRWWEAPKVGLSAQLLSQLPPTWLERLQSISKKPDDDADDAIKTLIDNNSARGYHGANDMVSGTGFSHAFEAIGNVFGQLSEYPKLYAISQAMPIVRALLLMLVYAFLPFVLIFSGFRIRTLVTMSFIIFSLIFWSYLWRLVEYVDTALIQALYGSWFHAQTPQATLTDFIIGALMTVIPIFWFSLMGAAGVGSGVMLEGLVGKLIGAAQQSGDKGRAVAKAVGSALIPK